MREIYPCMGRSCRDNRFEMGREFLERRPLVLTSIRASPHGHLPIAPGLLCQPFDDIMSILAFTHERLKHPLGVAAPRQSTRAKA